ncbi:hypothetical protein [Amycolatopsis suaedae]|uniref:Anti-sigma factor n=1 Tax=Amycolatopsis suaedae TaxID=2510978 RepID=A0A4Q7JB29_9PSEU|nr:hypothetical protein [Amycolatopsis suaedae]RZQ65010.1 hypothetical protein EWH70_03645 [Amycolatopsis suaedae]
MTDEARGIGGAVGPPWSVDVLADLHAGVLDEQEAARLWPQVEADPEALAIIEALEATTADLAAWGNAAPEPMPADVAARIDAALAEEAEKARPAPAVAPVVSIDVARKRRNRMIAWGSGVLATAAAAVAVVAVVLPGTGGENGSSDVAQPPAATSKPAPGSPGEAPLALKQDDLDVGSVLSTQGTRDFGPLGTQERLDACLSQNGEDPRVKAVGVKGVTLDGKPGTMVLRTTGELAQYRLLVLGEDCSKLLDRTIGRGA